mgnify:CR=1 FL=1
MKEAKYWEVKFKYNYPNIPGEEVRVAGNTESLGNWNAEIAPKLIYDLKKECWVTKNHIKIPASFDLEYKYLIYKNNKLEKWEQLESNRKVKMPEKEKLIFNDEQNNPETSVIRYYPKTKKKVTTKMSSKNLKTSLKGVLKPPKIKKMASTKRTIKHDNVTDEKDNEIKISEFNPNDKDQKVVVKENVEKNKKKENAEFEESTDDYEDLDYDSFFEDEDANVNSRMSSNIRNDVEINDEDEIIMVSTYIPFNPVREKDGNFKFILTNEAIYHTLYRVIESKKNINGSEI